MDRNGCGHRSAHNIAVVVFIGDIRCRRAAAGVNGKAGGGSRLCADGIAARGRYDLDAADRGVQIRDVGIAVQGLQFDQPEGIGLGVELLRDGFVLCAGGLEDVEVRKHRGAVDGHIEVALACAGVGRFHKVQPDVVARAGCETGDGPGGRPPALTVIHLLWCGIGDQRGVDGHVQMRVGLAAHNKAGIHVGAAGPTARTQLHARAVAGRRRNGGCRRGSGFTAEVGSHHGVVVGRIRLQAGVDIAGAGDILRHHVELVRRGVGRRAGVDVVGDAGSAARLP